MSSQSDKKEEFRKYLEKGNVLGLLTNILTDLFEMDNKPESPCQYLYQRVGDFINKGTATNPDAPTAPATGVPANNALAASLLNSAPSTEATPTPAAAAPTNPPAVPVQKDVAMAEAPAAQPPIVAQPDGNGVAPPAQVQATAVPVTQPSSAAQPAVPAAQPTPGVVPTPAQNHVVAPAPVDIKPEIVPQQLQTQSVAPTSAPIDTAQQPQISAAPPAVNSVPAVPAVVASQPQQTTPVAGVPNPQAPVQ